MIMKKYYGYLIATFAGAAMLASCEQMEDFKTTVDAPDVLVYATTGGSANIHSTKVAHAPVGSFGSYNAVFPITCNSGSHKAASVTISYNLDAANAYKEAEELEHSILPAANVRIAKYVKGSESTEASASATLTLPENSRVTADSVQVVLVGDLSTLTEKSYIAALTITSDAFHGSETLGTYYLEVLTEINCIRPIESTSDIAGFKPLSRETWTADCGNYARLFDGNTGSYAANFPQQTGNVVTIDMQEKHILTGFRIAGYYFSYYPVTISAIEYSLDGENWSQAGTPDGSEYNDGTYVNIAFYGYIEARFIKFTVDFYRNSSYYQRLSEFDIFEVESTSPTLYFECGDANKFTGKIKHTPSGSSSSIDFSFPVKVAPLGSAGISGTVAVDNSLITTYNETNGTRYEALPAANLKLDYSAFSIPAGSVNSDNVNVSITGDINGLRSASGYLIPLKISSSAAVSETRGVVYVIAEVIEQNLKSNPSTDDLAGMTLVSDRNGWTATDGNGNAVTNIFGTSSWSGSTANPIIVDLGGESEIGAIALGSVYANYGANYRVTGATLSYSTDGTDFTGLGVAESSDFVWDGNYQVAVLASSVKARYIKVADLSGNYFYGLNNFNVYVK